MEQLNMGYMSCISPCYGCKNIFEYNPYHVPSIRINDVREPVCEACMHKINAYRIDHGLDPFYIYPDAYQPIDEDESPEVIN